MSRSFSRYLGVVWSVAAGVTFLPLPTVVAADSPANPTAVAPAAPNTPPPAPPDRTGRGRGAGANVQGQRGNFVGGLNLDDQQRELLREATQKEGDEMRKLNDKLQTAQKELVQAIIGEKYDEKVVREKAEAAARIQTEITMLRAKAFATVAPTLKPEQREQLDNPQVANFIIMSGGGGFGGGRGFAAPGGPGGPGGPGFRGGPEGQPPADRNFRRRDGGSGPGGNPDQPRRRGAPDQ
jgi:Spy/CpxP family protein refolding chaperone